MTGDQQKVELKGDESMEEVETVREIEEPYQGSLEARIHDLFARITESDPCNAEQLTLVGSYRLLEFATSHVEDLDRLRDEVIDLWRKEIVR